jgi:endo-1,4-beta-D-glucanase Y
VVSLACFRSGPRSATPRTRHIILWDATGNELARIELAQAVKSWHCSLAQNLEVLKAEADFASDCDELIWMFRG